MLKFIVTLNNDANFKTEQIIPKGQSGSITDYGSTNLGELLIFTHNENNNTAKIELSRSGVHTEKGNIREIMSFDLQLEKLLDLNNRVYKRPITLKNKMTGYIEFILS